MVSQPKFPRGLRSLRKAHHDTVLRFARIATELEGQRVRFYVGRGALVGGVQCRSAPSRAPMRATLVVLLSLIVTQIVLVADAIHHLTEALVNLI